MRVHRYSEQFKSDALALIAKSDRSVRQVAIGIGVDPWTLRYWYKKANAMANRSKKAQLGLPPIVHNETQAERSARLEREIVALRKENEQLKMDREIRKSSSLLRKGKRVRFSFVQTETAFFPVSALCRVLRVTRHGYYAFANRKPSKRDREAAELDACHQDTRSKSSHLRQPTHLP